MKRLLCFVCSLSLIVTPAISSHAQSEFKKVVKNKHTNQKVSCFSCHTRKANVPEDQLSAFKENKKSFRNSFGKEFDKLFEGKDMSKRLKEAKKLKKAGDTEKAKQIKSDVIEEFKAALEKVEKIKSPEGPTYGELLEKGTLTDGKPAEAE